MSDKLTNSAPEFAPALTDELRSTLSTRSTLSAGGGITVLAYLDLLFSNSVTFTTKPSLALTVPAKDIAAASYYVAAYDPSRPSLGWQLGFEGPAVVNGTTLAFTGAATPFTFAANADYYFATYAISASAAAPTPAPSVPAIVPTPAPGPYAVQTVTLTSGGNVSLELPDGYVGSLTLPQMSASSSATIQLSKSPPAGTNAVANAGIYATITPKSDITFTSGTTSGSFTSPKPFDKNNLTYRLALFVPGAGGVPGLPATNWLLGPPGTVSDQTVSFSYTLTGPISIPAGTSYVAAITGG